MALTLTQMFALSRPCCDLCVSRYIPLEILFERGRHLGHRLDLDRSITSWNISANSGMPGAIPIDVKVIALARRRRSSMRPSRKSLTPRSGNRPYGPPVAHDSGLGSWRIGLPCTDQVRTGALTPLPHQIFPLTAARTRTDQQGVGRRLQRNQGTRLTQQCEALGPAIRGCAFLVGHRLACLLSRDQASRIQTQSQPAR